MTTCLCENLLLYYEKLDCHLSGVFIKESFVEFFVNPSLPGVLLFFILFIESNRSVISRISFPRRSDCSFAVLIFTELRNSCFSALVFEFKVLFKECFVKRFDVIRYFLVISYFFFFNNKLPDSVLDAQFFFKI